MSRSVESVDFENVVIVLREMVETNSNCEHAVVPLSSDSTMDEGGSQGGANHTFHERLEKPDMFIASKRSEKLDMFISLRLRRSRWLMALMIGRQSGRPSSHSDLSATCVICHSTIKEKEIYI